MKRRVVITGMGVVTSLSRKVDDLWNRLLAGESGVHPLKLFDIEKHKVKFGGDIYDWLPTDYISSKELKRVDRFTQFAVVAGTDAITDSGLDFEKEDAVPMRRHSWIWNWRAWRDRDTGRAPSA